MDLPRCGLARRIGENAGVQLHVRARRVTWYTECAAGTCRLIVESLLGERVEGDLLRIEPCLPADWNGFTVHDR